MPLRLSVRDKDFEALFAGLLEAKRESRADVQAVVRDVIEGVRARGDDALLDYTLRFDRLNAALVAELRVSDQEIEEAVAACNREVVAALETAAARIRAFHERQRPQNFSFTDEAGVRMGMRWTSVDSVGIYVPGGLASYPSSVLMNAVPAQVAGVQRIVMAVPSPGGALNPVVLAAARVAGVTEIWRIGGAQAIAALAYGTRTIRPVDKIVGPGNAYVAEAKRQVFGVVGIEAVAGPSEILVVADAANDPDWIALDLLSQAEHDESAQSILITDDKEFADQVADAVRRQLEHLPRASIAGASWRDHGAILVVDDLGQAPALVDRLAPEHLELAVADPDALAAQVRHAGAIFMGRHTPEAVGDYVGGPNHVLPTARSARFSSGLGLIDFMKRTTLLHCDPAGLRRIGPAAVTLAQAEGLDAHARSVAVRLEPAG